MLKSPPRSGGNRDFSMARRSKNKYILVAAAELADSWRQPGPPPTGPEAGDEGDDD